MKTKADILAELKKLRTKLEQAVACQQLIGLEGYRLLVEAVANEVRGYGKRLMQMDCGPEETNQLRAKITSLNWFTRWAVGKSVTIQDLVKRMEGLQTMAQQRHDPTSVTSQDEIDKLVAEVKQFQQDLIPQETT